MLQLIPLLVESLDQREVVLLLSTLDILQDLMESKHLVLEEHIQTFLPRFLKLARFPDSLVSLELALITNLITIRN